MTRLFISHPSANDTETVAIRDWLAAAGWDGVFLERGIKGRWERTLNGGIALGGRPKGRLAGWPEPGSEQVAARADD